MALGLGYLVAAGLLALPALVTAGPAPLIIGVIGAIAVWTYSGGILPISYLPIGEFVSGFVMGGLIPMGIVAAVSSTFDFSVLPAALPFIISIGLIMMTNNTSDIEKDRQAKRRTLPALLGRTKAVRLYRAAVWIWMHSSASCPYGISVGGASSAGFLYRVCPTYLCQSASVASGTAGAGETDERHHHCQPLWQRCLSVSTRDGPLRRWYLWLSFQTGEVYRVFQQIPRPMTAPMAASVLAWKVVGRTASSKLSVSRQRKAAVSWMCAVALGTSLFPWQRTGRISRSQALTFPRLCST